MFENIFHDEIIVPDEVQKKVNTTLAQIQREGEVLRKKKRKTFLNKRIVAASMAGIIGISGVISVSAAIYYKWGRGIKDGMQITDAQLEKMSEDGMVLAYGENTEYSSMAVTQNGVTVVPEMAVVDDHYAKLTFRVSGYQVPDNRQPVFEVYEQSFVGEKSEHDLNIGKGFYSGIIMDENGMAVNDAGAWKGSGEPGEFTEHWTDENGCLDFVVDMWCEDGMSCFLGKELEITLKNLGYYSGKAESVVTEIEGTWEFTIKLPERSLAKTITVGKTAECEYNSFFIDRIDVSPISTKMYYSVSEGEEYVAANNEIPLFVGYVLKDGTRVICNIGGGMRSTANTKGTSFVELRCHSRIVDVDQIDKLIVRLTPGGTEMELEIQ